MAPRRISIPLPDQTDTREDIIPELEFEFRGVVLRTQDNLSGWTLVNVSRATGRNVDPAVAAEAMASFFEEITHPEDWPKFENILKYGDKENGRVGPEEMNVLFQHLNQALAADDGEDDALPLEQQNNSSVTSDPPPADQLSSVEDSLSNQEPTLLS